MPFESLLGPQQGVLDNVVPQDDAHFFAPCKVFGQAQSVCDSAFPFLVGKVELLQAKIFPIPQQTQKVAGTVAAGNDQDVVDASLDQRLQRIVEHRLIVDRQ